MNSVFSSAFSRLALSTLIATQLFAISASAIGKPRPKPSPTPTPTETAPPNPGATFNAETADRAVSRAYRAILMREADPDGKRHAVQNVLQNQLDGFRSTLTNLSTSDEFKNNVRPSKSDEQILSSLYHGLLLRGADPSGSASYLPMIARGEIAQAAIAIGTSAEFFEKLENGNEPGPTPTPTPTSPPGNAPFTGIRGAQLGANTAEKWITLEWTIENPSQAGNPFDLEARAVFTHEGSGEQRRTDLFYAGGSSWKFRFFGTREGKWNFNTESGDSDLNGRSGFVTVTAPAAGQTGLLKTEGDKFVLEGRDDRAFIPQYAMGSTVALMNSDRGKIDYQVNTFIRDHKFTGLHVQVACSWINVSTELCDGINSDSRLDLRTFEVLEELLTKTRAAGGAVHFWMWGDDDNGRTPKRYVGGLNSLVERRVQKYIAARFGALPNWSMGYGYDVWEWATDADLRTWHSNMKSKMGWDHILGARGHHAEKLHQVSEAMDYSGYEDFRPSMGTYLEAFSKRPNKPVMFEDRFRVNQGPNYVYKDYTFDETRRGLWHSAMAGGASAIWGNIQENWIGHSREYPAETIDQIRTNSHFFNSRFFTDSKPCNDLVPGSNANVGQGVCLASRGSHRYVFYREGGNSIQMDLRGMPERKRAVAVDTRQAYKEIDLGFIDPSVYTFNAPNSSDWAVSVGVVGSGELPPVGGGTAPLPPPADGCTSSVDNDNNAGVPKALPNAADTVKRVAEQYPNAFRNSCREQGGNNEFLFRLVAELRKTDVRWGLNWKRGNVGDMSQDVVNYYLGQGPFEGRPDTYVVDVIGGHCGSNPQPAWNDVTCYGSDGRPSSAPCNPTGARWTVQPAPKCN